MKKRIIVELFVVFSLFIAIFSIAKASTTLTCRVTGFDPAVEGEVTFFEATGGDGINYSWNAPGGYHTGSGGNEFSAIYPHLCTDQGYTATVVSGGETASCELRLPKESGWGFGYNCVPEHGPVYDQSDPANRTSGGGPGPGSGTGGSGELENPLGVKTLGELAQKIGSALLSIAIPIAVLLIIWSGIKMMISQGNPEKVASARKSLWYIVLGLAVLLIGQGFVSLIKSILELKK